MVSNHERALLISTCSLMTGYAESYYEKMTDAELLKVYESQIPKTNEGANSTF